MNKGAVIAVALALGLYVWSKSKSASASALNIFGTETGGKIVKVDVIQPGVTAQQQGAKIIAPANLTPSEAAMYEAIDTAVASGQGYADIMRANVGPAWDLNADTPGRLESMQQYWQQVHPGEALPTVLQYGYSASYVQQIVSDALGLNSLNEASELIESGNQQALSLLTAEEKQVYDKLKGTNISSIPVTTPSPAIVQPVTPTPTPTYDYPAQDYTPAPTAQQVAEIIAANPGAGGITSSGEVVTAEQIAAMTITELYDNFPVYY